jgi:hypothetical protein
LLENGRSWRVRPTHSALHVSLNFRKLRKEINRIVQVAAGDVIHDSLNEWESSHPLAERLREPQREENQAQPERNIDPEP